MKKNTDRIHLLFLLAASAFIFSSCSTNTDDNTYDKPYPVPVYNISFFADGFALNYSCGMYDDNSYDYNLMCLADYDAKAVVPMCSRPNCGHTGKENCAAAKGYQASLVYNGTFYGFTTGDDAEIDGTTRRSTIDVITSNIDGSGERTIANIEGMIFGLSSVPRDSSMLVFEGNAYFPVHISDLINGIGSNYAEYHLIRLSLETGDVTDLGIIVSGYGTFVTTLGATAEKAYFNATYREYEIKLSDFDSTEEYLEAIENAEYIEEYVSVDLSDGAVTKAELPGITFSSRIVSNTYFYNDENSFYKYNLLTGETEKLHDHLCHELYYVTDDRLFYTCNEENTTYAYDMTDGSTVVIPGRTDSIRFSPFKFKDGWCYGEAVGLLDEEGIPVMAYCREKDFFAKENCELTILSLKD